MAYLAQSGQLYNEANIFAFSKVYCFGPTFRAEKSKTRRHLTEFWMVEPEMAFCDLDQLMEIEEQFVSHIVQRVAGALPGGAEIAGARYHHPCSGLSPPFPRISYDDALQILKQIREETDDPEQKELLKIEWGMDFGAPHETALTERFDKPVFVYGYPTQVKAFYMEPWPGRPEVCKSVDLLAPEGYGEIIGGSERISDPDLLLQRLHQHDLPEDAFQLVYRPAPLRQRAAQRLWPGRRAHRLLADRHQAYPRDHRLPAHHQAGVSVAARQVSASLQSFGRFAYPKALFIFHLRIAEPVSFHAPVQPHLAPHRRRRLAAGRIAARLPAA